MSNLMKAVSIGISLFIAYETRTMSLALLVALFAYDILAIIKFLVNQKLQHTSIDLPTRTIIIRNIPRLFPYNTFWGVSSCFYNFLPKSGGEHITGTSTLH